MSEPLVFPDDWTVLPIGELGQVKLGRQRAPRFTLGVNPKPYLRVVNVFENRLDLRDVMSMDFTESELREYRLEHGDVLLTEGDLGSAYNVGRSAVYRSEIKDCCFTNTLIRFRRHRKESPPEYFQHAFELLRRYGKFAETTAATTVFHLSSGRLKKVLAPVAPLPEQKKIARILTTLDNLIEKTEALIAKYQSIKQGMMHDLFTRGVDSTGKLRPPQEEAPHLYKLSPLGWIPNEWETSGLKSKGHPNRSHLRTGPFGSALKGEHWRDQGVPVVTIGSLGEGEFIDDELLHIETEYAKRLLEFWLRPGDIVFSRVADVGRSVVVSEAEEGWIMSSNLMRISLDEGKADPYFTYLCIAFNQDFRAQIRRSVNAGGRDVANSDVMNSLSLPWPKIEEQRHITRIMRSHESRLTAERQQLAKLHTLKSGLMQDLLTGKVRVKVDEAEGDGS